MIKYLIFKKEDLDKVNLAMKKLSNGNIITRITRNSSTEIRLRIENRISDENSVYDFIDDLKSELE